MIALFKRPLLPGWIYPCTLADIEERLSHLPASDLEGLWAVGLIPSTRKDCNANGRYVFDKHPTIYLYSHPETLTFKLRQHTKRSEIEAGCAVELEYGMWVEASGSRWICCWKADDLRRFILDHVLQHEIGHHVHYYQRVRQGLRIPPSRQEIEQFAEAYARRHSRHS